MRNALKLCTVALFVGALTLAVSQTSGVKADAFTDAGCPTGNYSCLYTNTGGVPAPYYPGYGYAYGQADPFAAVGCADGDLNCYYTKVYGTAYTGYPPYGYPYYTAPAPASGGGSASSSNAVVAVPTTPGPSFVPAG